MNGYPPKSEWGPGPWQDEPDEERWTSKVGLPCLAWRNRGLGNWCGYVQVPSTSPLAELGYDSYPISSLRVHGGFTFADGAEQMVAGLWEDRSGYVYGFDCGHAQDMMPGHIAFYTMKVAAYPRLRLLTHYRDLPYVRDQCEWVAQQLVRAEKRLLAAYGEHTSWVLQYVNEVPASYSCLQRRRALIRRTKRGRGDLAAYGSVYRLGGAAALDRDLGLLP